MHVDDDYSGIPYEGNTERTLSGLASALSCSVGDFYGSMPVEMTRFAEVVRLWGLLTSGDDQDRVLRLLRDRKSNSQLAVT
jgi:hypothetical protein